MRITLRCTPTQSVPQGFRCVQYIRLLNTADRRVSCTNKQGSRITRNNKSDRSATSDVQHKTGRKTKEASRTASVSEREGTTSTDMGRKTNFITLLDWCVSSQHCHITQYVTVVGVNMVVIGCSSQQIGKKNRRSQRPEREKEKREQNQNEEREVACLVGQWERQASTATPECPVAKKMYGHMLVMGG